MFVDKMIDSNRDTDLRDAGEKRVEQVLQCLGMTP